MGLAGLAFEHVFRVIFGKPVYAAVFLVINGLILLAGERFRSRASLKADEEVAADREYALEGAAWGHARPYPGEARSYSGAASPYPGEAGHAVGRRDLRHATSGRDLRHATSARDQCHATSGRDQRHTSSRDLRLEEMDNAVESDERLSRMGYGQAVIIGSAQVLALLAGISRDGVTMVAGMARGLSREDAARFAFLLATPVILAAGVLKIPDLMGPLGHGIRGQVVVGSVLSGVGAYISVKYLVRYFQTRTLTPFGIYCIVAGLASIAYLYLVK